MPQIVQSSSFNPASLQVDDLYIVIQPPPGYIQGVQVDVIGMVGTASWGPLNQAVLLGNISQVVQNFGPIGAPALTDARDIATDATLALIQGQGQASPQIWGVRVSDGTDVKATRTLSDTVPVVGITLTAIYTGIMGNQINIILTAGAKTGTTTVTIVPWSGAFAEVFPNLPSTGAGVFWSALLTAINSGMNGGRGPSQLVVASAASGTAIAPAIGSFTMSGGTDGRAGVTTAMQLGSDAAQPKTGMYALRSQNPPIGVFWLCGNNDPTSYAGVQILADSEGALGLLTFPTGTSTATAITARQTAGIDDYNIVFIKDYVWFFDTANNQARLIAPMPVVGGRIASLAPQFNPGNKPVFGIMGTERVNNILPPNYYSIAEIGQLEAAGITLVASPCPGGTFFGMRHGQNSSSNPVQAVIEYGRMTNFLAKSLANYMGKFVGQNQTINANDPLRSAVANVLSTFLEALRVQGQIDSYQVICDLSNNSANSIAAHYLYAQIKVRYLSSVKFFVLNLQGGTTVVTIGNSLGDILQP